MKFSNYGQNPTQKAIKHGSNQYVSYSVNKIMKANQPKKFF